MDVVAHIGPSKTGTTAIQTTLAMHREQLLAGGVLYPSTLDEEINHNVLAAGSRPKGDLPRLLRHRFEQSGEAPLARFHDEVANIRRQITDLKPKVVILSGEYLFFDLNRHFETFWNTVLGDHFDNARFVAYIRDPADRALSMVQQQLKQSSNFDLSGSRIREVLESYEKSFPGKLEIRPFDRAGFPDGDIVKDFLSVAVPDAEFDSIGSVSANETIGAEAMALLQEYRKTNYPTEDNVPKVDALRFLQVLKRLDQGGVKPVLKETVRQYVREQCRRDMDWLKRQYGIDLGINREGWGLAEGENLDVKALRDVKDICHVDEGRKSALSMRALKMLLSSDAPAPFKNRVSSVKRGMRRLYGWMRTYCGIPRSTA